MSSSALIVAARGSEAIKANSPNPSPSSRVFGILLKSPYRVISNNSIIGTDYFLSFVFFFKHISYSLSFRLIIYTITFI